MARREREVMESGMARRKGDKGDQRPFLKRPGKRENRDHA
jgi:hypothetical protein